MDPWWWVPIGLAAWFLVAIVAALIIGPILGRSAQARESYSQKSEDTPGEREPPEDARQAS